jgi:hypothetical protein
MKPATGEIATPFLAALGTIVYLACLVVIAIAVFGPLNVWLFHIPLGTR